jgi:hypothetical protein
MGDVSRSRTAAPEEPWNRTHATAGQTRVARRRRIAFDWGLPSALGQSTSPSLIVLIVATVGALVVGASAQLGVIPATAALFAVAAALAVLVRPALGGLALVCLVPAVAGLARGLLVPGIKLNEVVVAGAACLVLLACGRHRTLPYGAVELLALGYLVATAVLGMLNLHRNGQPLTSSSVAVLLAPVQFLLILRGVRVALQTTDVRRLALRWALYLSVPLSLLAISQQLVGPVLNPLLAEITSSNALRGPSTALFTTKHDLGGYLLVVVLVCVALLMTKGHRVLASTHLWVVLVLSCLALACTAALAAVGGAVLGIALMAKRRRRVLPALGTFLVITSTVAVLFGPTIHDLVQHQFTSTPVVTGTTSAPSWLPHGVAYRQAVWQDQYIPVLSQHLLTGYGPTLPPEVEWQFTESTYLTLLMRGGIPLLIIVLALGIALYNRSRAAELDAEPLQRALGLAVSTLVVVLAVVNATNPYILNAGLPQFLWALAGLLVVAPVPRTMMKGARRSEANR